MYLLSFVIGIYHAARSTERQMLRHVWNWCIGCSRTEPTSFGAPIYRPSKQKFNKPKKTCSQHIVKKCATWI